MTTDSDKLLAEISSLEPTERKPLRPAPVLRGIPNPINLPFLTFLCGEPLVNGQKELATELANNDPGLGVYDFEEPFRMAYMEIFTAGFQPELDLTSWEVRKSPVPGLEPPSQGLTVGETIRLLASSIDLASIGAIALRRIVQDGADIGVYDRYLFRDCFNSKLLKSFGKNFDTNRMLCIHMNQPTPVSNYDAGMRHIFLASADPKEQIAQLRRELTP